MTRIARKLAVGAAVALLGVLAPSASADETATEQIAGLSAHLIRTGITDDEQNQELALLASAGAGITRVDVGWSSLEQNAKGQYEEWYLAVLDRLVAHAEAHGVKLLFTFTDSPCWASSAPEDLKQGCEGAWWDRRVNRYPPANAQDYADALTFLVRRYGSRVAGWEIWNEPNLRFFFASDNRPADYAQLVRVTYSTVKAADPSATVIAGSVSEAQFEFVDKLYDNGIRGHFDAFSIHPYSGDASPLDPLEDQWIANSFVRGVPAVHKVLRQNGDDKPLWLTEFGWNTSTLRNGPTWENGVSEKQQALYTQQALVKVKDWPYVPVAIIHELQDEKADRSERNANFGLLRYDGSMKPAFEAFHTGAVQLADQSTPRSVDPDEPRRLRVWLDRQEERVFARGVGEPRRVAKVRAYRYLRGKKRFARHPAYTARVRVRASGRIKRRLDERLAHGRWRLKAKYARSV